MDWRPDRLRWLRHGEVMEEEVNEEFEHHIAMRTEENIAAGMTPEDARLDALRRFGDIDAHRRRTRAIDRRMERGLRAAQHVDAARRALRHALRALMRRPGFTFVALLTLALGLGATTAIFTLLEAVVLRPLPYPHAERLVVIEHPVPAFRAGAAFGLSAASYFHYREHNRSLEELAAYTTTSMTVAGEREAERVRTARITASAQELLGAQVILGRLITPRDDAPGHAPIVLLGHGFWQRRYGGDAGVVGRVLHLDDAPYEVIGVLAPGIDLPWTAVDVWLPLALDPAARAVNNHVYSGLARLRAGVTPEAATTDLARLSARFPSVFPEAYSEAFMTDTRFTTVAVSLRDRVLGDLARVLWILFGSVALVLVIACANVANLFLVRAEAMRREVGIRSALGAGRRDLAWHHVTESVLLALVAGVVSLVLAQATVRVLVAMSPTRLPHIDRVAVSPVGIASALGVALVAGVVFGLFPLARATASIGLLRDGGRGATPSRRRQAVRNALVGGQVALALVLLASAALLWQSFRNLQRVELGVDARGVFVFDLTLPRRYDTDEKVNDFYRELTARLVQLPGAMHASVTSQLPVSGGGGCASVFISDRLAPSGEEPPCVYVAKASPGLVESLGMLVRGRTPAWSDGGGGTGTAVVTQAAADRLWPGQAAIGKGIRVNGEGPPYYEVVGVVPELRAGGPDSPPTEAVFLPMLPLAEAPLWGPSRSVTVVLRTGSDAPQTYLSAAKRIVAALDAEVPLANPRSLEQVVAQATSRTSFTMALLGSAAALALVLSMVGLYGVISYVVGQRLPELGIRMALGARGGEVAGLVIWQAARIVAAGVLIGLLVAWLLTRSLDTLLFEVHPGDARTLAVAAAALLTVSLLASWGPARRAARADPLTTLREQ